MPAHQPAPRSPIDPRAHPRSGTLARGAERLIRGILAVAMLAALLAGIPWGLCHYVGWPLPHRIPTWPDIEVTLLSPMSMTFLVNTLACFLWPTWAVFVLDVARATWAAVTTAEWHAARPAGPLRSLAAALVGTVVFSLLSHRATPSGQGAVVGAMYERLPAATATSAGPAVTEADRIVFSRPTAHPATRPDDGTSGTVVVLAPRNGIYDSLWRVAYRALGDGSRWPQLYALNRGRPQPDGETLTDPNLIRPGWVLCLPGPPPSHADSDLPRPTGAQPSPLPTAPSSKPASPSASVAPAPPSSPSATTAPAHPPSDHNPGPHLSPGINLPSGAFLGLGLAGLISAALLAVRLRRRVRYQPGSGAREDLAIAPVVRALRIAYEQSATEAGPDGIGPTAYGAPRADMDSAADAEGHVPDVPADGRVIGVKDSQALAWNLARARGLGLVGPGAPDAIRALLIALLAERQQPAARRVDILMPAADASMLLGEWPAGRRIPARLRIVRDLDAALETMERELLSRTRAAIDHEGEADSELVLIATPAEQNVRRLQAVLDNGSTVGMTGVLLGQWRPGGTARIRPDGTVAAIDPALSETLGGARLFTLPAADARDLLDLLHEAEPSTEPTQTGTTPQDGPREPERLPAERAESRQPQPIDPGYRDTDPNPQPSPASSAEVAPPVGTTLRTLLRADTDTAAVQPDQRAERTALPEAPAEKPPAEPALHLTVLGRIRLTRRQDDRSHDADLTGALAPKQREVLAYLALHPDGARREALTTAIWPDAPSDRPYNSFHATLSQLRRALRTATHEAFSDITRHRDGHYTLNRELVDVDLWQLQDALRLTRGNLDEQQCRTILEGAISLYTGDLAEGLTAEWLETPREAVRRDVLDAVSALVRLLREREPEQALALLERARSFDRYNEVIYRDIARFQAHLGQHDAVPRTLALLTATLAELGDQPDRETLGLFELLQRPRLAGRTTGGLAAS